MEAPSYLPSPRSHSTPFPLTPCDAVPKGCGPWVVHVQHKNKTGSQNLQFHKSTKCKCQNAHQLNDTKEIPWNRKPRDLFHSQVDSLLLRLSDRDQFNWFLLLVKKVLLRSSCPLAWNFPTKLHPAWLGWALLLDFDSAICSNWHGSGLAFCREMRNLTQVSLFAPF